MFYFIKTLLFSDLNLIWLNHQSFGIFFKNNKHFNNSFHSCSNTVSYDWKLQWVMVSYDWRIWCVVSYKSVSYRKGMHVLIFYIFQTKHKRALYSSHSEYFAITLNIRHSAVYFATEQKPKGSWERKIQNYFNK